MLKAPCIDLLSFYCSKGKARDHSMSTLHQVWKCGIFFQFASQGLGAELFLGEPEWWSSVPYTNFPHLLLRKQGEKQPPHVLLEHKRKYKDTYPQTITSSYRRHLIIKKEIKVGCEIIHTLECGTQAEWTFSAQKFLGTCSLGLQTTGMKAEKHPRPLLWSPGNYTLFMLST